MLSVQATRSQLTGAELTRTAGSGGLSISIALALWSALDVEAVTRLRVGDAGAVAALADARVLSRFTALRVLNISNAGLGALPASVGLLSELQVRRRPVEGFSGSTELGGRHAGMAGTESVLLPTAAVLAARVALQELRVVGNQLRILPPEIGRLAKLRVLAADSNQLTILPGGQWHILFRARQCAS